MKNAKIFLFGEGGQGVKMLAQVLGLICESKGKKVSVVLNYDSAVRGGDTSAHVVISDEISSPVFDKEDINLNLKEGTMKEKNAVADVKSLFQEKSKGRELFLNMFSLGILLKKLGINIKSIDLKTFLPSFKQKENLESIEEGFNA